MKDFFISYNKADEPWAVWVAWILEAAGYEIIIRAWDFQPGGNFIVDMNTALAKTKKLVLILSKNYINGLFTLSEWASVMVSDPQGRRRAIVPFKVGECETPPLLLGITYVELMGLSEADAKAAVLGAFKGRAKPDSPPVFPGELRRSGDDRKPKQVARFPGGTTGSAEGSITEALYETIPTVTAGAAARCDARGGAWQEDERLSLWEELRSLPTHQFNVSST